MIRVEHEIFSTIAGGTGIAFNCIIWLAMDTELLVPIVLSSVVPSVDLEDRMATSADLCDDEVDQMLEGYSPDPFDIIRLFCPSDSHPVWQSSENCFQIRLCINLARHLHFF